MRFIYFSLWSILILFSSLFGEDPEITTLASTEGLLNSLIAGHVCPISGEFIYSQTDLFVPGPTPLAVQRSYRSRNIRGSHIHKSWQLFEPIRMISDVDLDSKSCKVTVPTSLGAELTYHFSETQKNRGN